VSVLAGGLSRFDNSQNAKVIVLNSVPFFVFVTWTHPNSYADQILIPIAEQDAFVCQGFVSVAFSGHLRLMYKTSGSSS